MASAEYAETYVNQNVGRNVEQRSYEEINAYENEERTMGGPQTTAAMPPPQPLPPQQEAARSHEMKKYGLKWFAVAFVMVSVIFAGMFVAVFVILTTGSEQGVTHKNVNDQQTKTILESFEKNLTSVMNKALNRVTIDGWYLASDGLLYKKFTDRTNYTTAKSRCENFGGILLTKGLRSVSVFREIRENVLHTFSEPWTWIGYYKVAENNWQWLDGGANNTEVVVWKEGEPNNYDGNEACADISKIHQSIAEINDAPCDQGYPFVCER